MFLKKNLFIFLLFFFFNIFAFTTNPYSLGFEFKENLNHNFSQAKNIFSTDTNYSYNLLNLEPNTTLIKHSIKQNFYFTITKSFFTFELNLSFFPFIKGEKNNKIFASESMSDSLLNFWFKIYHNSKNNIFSGIIFSLPSGNSEKFTGEGHFKSGLALKFSGQYLCEQRYRSYGPL
jgi:hypothetical protein